MAIVSVSITHTLIFQKSVFSYQISHFILVVLNFCSDMEALPNHMKLNKPE